MTRRISKRRTSRRPQKRTSRGMRANVKPSVKMPVAPRNVTAWVRRTFAPGTPVKTLADVFVVPAGHLLLHASGKRVGAEMLPAGSRGVVTEAGAPFGIPEIRVEITDARDAAGKIDRVIGKVLSTLNADAFEPLVDNWLRPNKRTSRGVRRNATCPSCGSQHYFEGLTTRDCAEPGCRYYAGGTPIAKAAGDRRPRAEPHWTAVPGGPSAEPHWTSFGMPPLPSGCRKIVVTYDRTTPSDDPDGDPDLDSGFSEEIEIGEDDFDADAGESFADYAASWIQNNLGGVEQGGGAYYQADAEQDYADGSETRRCAHLNPRDGWTHEEIRKVDEILKQQKLLLANRGVRRNPVPPPPPAGRDLDVWARKTFAVGTPTRLRMQWPFTDDDGTQTVMPAGTVARVIELESSGLIISTEVVAPVLFSATRKRLYASLYYGSAERILEPLVDNWPDPTPSRRRHLPPSQRQATSMKHRRLLPNPIPPPPPDPLSRHFESWIQRTFAPGTPVRWKDSLLHVKSVHPGRVRFKVVAPPADKYGLRLSDEDRAKVEALDFDLGYPAILTDWRYGDLKVLTDNWAAHQATTGRPWKGRHTAPNRRTSRRR